MFPFVNCHDVSVAPIFVCSQKTDKTENVRIQQHSGALCNICHNGREIRITYCMCVFLALGIHHVMLMSHDVICGLPS